MPSNSLSRTAPARHARTVAKRKSVDEELRAGLYEVAMAGTWWPEGQTGLIDAALRRWHSFDRRSKPGHRTPELRVQDLARGLQEQFGDDIYLEPGWLNHVADRFGAYLRVWAGG